MAAKATRAAKSAAPAKAEEAASAPPAKETAPEAARPTAPDPDTGEDEGADEAVPMNRAERRAKGRGQSLSQVPGGRGKVTGSHGPAHAHRNWANRRSG